MISFRKYAIALALVLFFGASVQAQTNSLSLEQAKEYALQHNRSIQQGGLAVEQAQKAKWEAISAGLPQVSAKVDYQNMLGYDLSLEMGGQAIPIEMEPTSNLNIQVTQLLFSANYWVGIRLASLAKELSQTSLKKSELDICRSVADSYHAILITEEMKNIYGSNLENMQKLLKNTDDMVRVGVAEQTDADQLRVQVTTMENNISSINRQIVLAYNMLRLQLGLDAEAEISLTDELSNFVSDEAIAALLMEPFEIKNNLDMMMLDQNVVLAKKQVNMAAADYFPTISAFYNYTYKIATSGFDMTPPHVVGVQANIPIFSAGGRYAKVKQAKLKRESAELQRDDVMAQLQIQEKQLRFNLRNAQENYQNQKKSIEVSDKVFKNISLKYEQGVASSLDLTNASNNLLVAQGSYVSALLELMNAESELNNLLGKK